MKYRRCPVCGDDECWYDLENGCIRCKACDNIIDRFWGDERWLSR